MLLKKKILEKYQSIRYFCKINDISETTLYHYLRGKRPINNMRAATLSQICTALECDPEDIGFTKSYWYVIPTNEKDKTRVFQYKL